MASKAYVASLTLSELKRELKQRGLSAKGTKKDLRDRLEQALDEEELDDPSSESDEEGVSHPLQGTGFNFEVLPESFIKEETPEVEVEPMIVSVELSNKEKLEVYSHKPVETSGHVRENKGPMIVAIELKSAQVQEEQGCDYSHRNGREAASNMDVQATAQQVETAASESKGEGESGQGSAQEEAAVKTEDERQKCVQQAVAPEVKESLPPQPVDVTSQAPDVGKQDAEVTAEVHQEPVKVQEPCVPGEGAPPSMMEEVPKPATSLEEKPPLPDEIPCPDTKAGDADTPEDADNSHTVDEKMETGEDTPPESNPHVLPAKTDKDPCVSDETTPSDVKMEEHLASDEADVPDNAKPPAEKSHVPDEATPPNEKSCVPDETTPPDVSMEEHLASDETKPPDKSCVPEPSAEKSHVTDAEPLAEKSCVSDETTPPNEESRVSDETTPPNEESCVSDETTPPNEESRVSDETTPPNEESRVSETTPPNEESHISDETTPPNEESRVADETTPPNEESCVPGEKMEEEPPSVPDEKPSVSQELHVPDNSTPPDVMDQCTSSRSNQASGTISPQGSHQHQEEPTRAEEGMDEISSLKNPPGENILEVVMPAESVPEEDVQSIEGAPEGNMSEDGQREQVKEFECRGEGKEARRVELDAEQQMGSPQPEEGEETEKAEPRSGEVSTSVEEPITESETVNKSAAVGEEGTEQDMETMPRGESVGEAECMEEEEGVGEPPKRKEEEESMEEELEHNSVEEKVTQKPMEGEREGHNPSQDEGEREGNNPSQDEGQREGHNPSQDEGVEPKPDFSANPTNVESVQPETKCGETKRQRRSPSNQEDPWEESAVAGREAGGDAGGGDQGVSETTLDSGLEQGSVDTSSAQEEVSQLALESGQIDVDVLVHAEEDDLSVFSTEAAEAVALATTRDRSRKAKHSPSSWRNSDYSRKREPIASSRSGKVASQPRKSPPVDSKRQRNDKPEPQYEQPSIKRRRISTQGSSSAVDGSVGTGSQERRRRWGSAKQRSGSTSATTISSDVLKDIIPAGLEGEGVEVEGGGVGVSTLALNSVMGYGGEEEEEEGEVGSEKSSEETATIENQLDSEHQKEWEDAEKEREVKRRAVERARQELETRRRIEARLRAKQEMEEKAKREENVKRRTPSPARNPPSRILHVEHLTRPFTVMQLKELLTEDGPMISDGFWTNKIKSHCIILYKSQESAVATRARIHGIKWPSTNPKLLCADYLTPSDVQRITDGEMVVEAVQEEEEEEEEEGEEEEEEEKEIRRESGEEEKMEAEGEKGGGGGGEEEEVVPSDTMATEMREEAPPSSSCSPKRVEKPAAEKEPSPPPAKKETHKATKLLDELFRKTKTTPSIYWLPLTDAQAKERQDLLRAREEEREKQRQERIRLRQEAREKEEKERREREERERKERERRIREERERRARERMRGRSRSRSRSRSRDRRRR